MFFLSLVKKINILKVFDELIGSTGVEWITYICMVKFNHNVTYDF